MLRLKTIIMALAMLTIGFVAANAQTDPLLSHYYEMPAYYNPGAIGNTDFIRIRGGARLQWLGIDHAPMSFVAVGDMPIKISSKRRMAVGLALQQESYGLYRNMTVGAMAGYQFRLLGGTLTPGVRIGLVNEVFRGSEVYLPDDDDYHQGTDDGIPTTDVSGNALDLGVGVNYVRSRWSAGLSLLHANSPTVRFSGENGQPVGGTGGGAAGGSDGEGGTVSTIKNYEFQVGRTLYFTASGNFPIKNTLFEIMPSIIAASDFDNYTGAATMMARYNRMISAGVGCRWNDAVALHLGVEIKNFYLGYSYEYPLSAISRASSGSHELIAGYSLKLDLGDKNRNKQKSIRIM